MTELGPSGAGAVDTEARLGRLLDAIHILSPTAFVLGNEAPIDLGARGLAERSSVASILQGHLYNMAYVREWPEGDPPLDASRIPPPDKTFMAQLAALRPAPVVDRGWHVREPLPQGKAVLTRNGWTREATANAWGPTGEGDHWLEIPQLHQDSAGCFVFLRGRTGGDGDEQGDLFRVYLHTRPSCVADVLSDLVRRLDREQVPFTLKTLMAPASAARADATVLYASRRCHSAVLSCVRRLPADLLDELGRATPLFSLPLRPGVAVAEDPPTGESFGMHRLRLLVEAVLGLSRRGIQDGSARRAALEARFVAEGLRLEAPHLGPGSTLAYDLGREPDSRPAPTDAAPGPPSAGQELELAARIGANLCRDAIWHEGRCVWQGWAVAERAGEDELVWRSLGPDLYRGGAGICLFLAQLERYTGGARLREVAVGGLEQALASLDRLDPRVRIGFHTGLAGIGHAALECGHLLGREDLVARGLEVLESTAAIELRPTSFDVVSGAAGCLPVLLAAATRSARPSLLDLASHLGDFLIESAIEDEGTAAWDGGHGRSPFCGFSHGASGVALALADLHAATGEERFLRVARAGLAYERRHFVPAARNWADLRLPPDSPRRASAMAWCHGAPGIALARLGLLDHLGDDEEVRQELDVALDSVGRSVAADAGIHLGNISLCHGACGNADVLLLAARRLERPGLEALARTVGERCAHGLRARGGSWPSGNPGAAPTPGLMLGDAGAGLFYLRLHDPDGIPSPLWVRPRPSVQPGSASSSPQRS